MVSVWLFSSLLFCCWHEFKWTSVRLWCWWMVAGMWHLCLCTLLWLLTVTGNPATLSLCVCVCVSVRVCVCTCVCVSVCVAAVLEGRASPQSISVLRGALGWVFYWPQQFMETLTQKTQQRMFADQIQMTFHDTSSAVRQKAAFGRSVIH